MGVLRKLAAALIALATLGAPSAHACPNIQLQPVFGEIILSAGFLPDPYTRRITAGGRHSIRGCLGFNWPGFVARRPDFSLYWTGTSRRMSIYVETRADSVLLINAPDLSWSYNDDINLQAGDLRSGITFINPRQGRYDIWIGSYDGSVRNPGTLVVTEY